MENDIVSLFSQEALAEDIVEDIIQFEDSKKNVAVFNLVGEDGCGKSVVVKNVIEHLPVGWSKQIIVGSENNILPNASLQICPREEVYLLPSFSLKCEILTLGLGLRFQEADSIFNDMQKKFIKTVNQTNGKCLIIVDNFDKLDEVSYKFVNSILNRGLSENWFKSYPIAFLLTTKSCISGVEKVYNMPKLSDEELQLLAKSKYQLSLDNVQLQRILEITNGNVKFINCILNANSTIDNEYTINSIVEKRIKEISNVCHISDIKSIEKICICGAYFEKGFTTDYLFKIFNDYKYDDIVELLFELSDLGLIEDQNGYKNYTVESIKNVLKGKSHGLEITYFRYMYHFYSEYYDYQYSTRLHFLYNIYLLDSQDSNIDQLHSLIFMSIVSLIYNRVIVNKEGVDKYLNKYPLICLDNNLINALYDIADNRLTFNFFRRLSIQNFDNLMLCEIMRLTLNSIPNQVETTETINHLILDAIELRENLSESTNKREKFAIFMLQEAIVSQLINRSTLFEKFNEQKDIYKTSLQTCKNFNKELYDELQNRFKRKSALFMSCDFTLQYLEDANKFYIDNKNIYEQYKVLVNMLGMYCIMSRVQNEQCTSIIESVEQLLNDNSHISFSEVYKFHNNKLLFEFLEQIYNCKTSTRYIKIAKKFLSKYNKLYKTYNKNLVRLNAVALKCIADPENAMHDVDLFLRDLAHAQNTDAFYQYFLRNYKIMLYIIAKDWVNAKKQLDKIDILTLPIFNDANKHYKKRLDALRVIITNQVECANIWDYDNLIYNIYSRSLLGEDYYVGNDETWKFISKSFIMTDAQFFD